MGFCILTYLLTYSMVQSPSWETNWFAASQEILRISRSPKVHYRTHKRPSPVPILGQPNPVLIPTSHLLEIHPNIIYPSTTRSPQWSLSLRFPHQDPIHPLSSPIRATRPAHLILLGFIIRTILGEEYKSFSSSLCNLLHSSVTSFCILVSLIILLKLQLPSNFYMERKTFALAEHKRKPQEESTLASFLARCSLQSTGMSVCKKMCTSLKFHNVKSRPRNSSFPVYCELHTSHFQFFFLKCFI